MNLLINADQKKRLLRAALTRRSSRLLVKAKGKQGRTPDSARRRSAGAIRAAARQRALAEERHAAAPQSVEQVPQPPSGPAVAQLVTVVARTRSGAPWLRCTASTSRWSRHAAAASSPRGATACVSFRIVEFMHNTLIETHESSSLASFSKNRRTARK